MTSTYLTRPQAIDPATVKGWGVDADPRNDPTYPMRDRSAENKPAGDYPMPTPQESGTEVLQSVEYEHRPAVFGVGPEPRAASGMLRRAAFRFSENDWWHWLLLLGADRVDMVEGLAADLGRGRVPNVPAEMGMPAAWRHNRGPFLGRVALISVGVAGLAFVLSGRKERRERGGHTHGPEPVAPKRVERRERSAGAGI